MEPIGLVASLVTLLAISKRISKVVKDIHGLPAELRALAIEISDLQQLFEDIEGVSRSTLRQPSEAVIQRILSRVEKDVGEANNLLTQLSALKRSSQIRVFWLGGGWKSTKSLRVSLSALRQELLAALEFTTASTSSRVEHSLDHVLQRQRQQSELSRQLLEGFNQQQTYLAALSKDQKSSTDGLRSIHRMITQAMPVDGVCSSVRLKSSIYAKTATFKDSFCSMRCQCLCHRHLSWDLPGHSRLFLGRVVFRTAGSRVSCSVLNCQSSSSYVSVAYFLPTWLCRRMLLLIYSNYCGPTINVAVRRVVPVFASPVLSMACQGNIVGVRKLFVQGKASPNDMNEVSGETPLHFAILYGKIDMCRALLDAGADAYLEDFWGGSAIDLAWYYIMSKSLDQEAENGLRSIFTDKEYFEHRRPQQLHRAVLELSGMSLTEALQEAGVEGIDHVDEQRRTALHWAAVRRDADCVRQLLDAGADINSKDANDRTPLWFAVRSMRSEVIDLLMARGADQVPDRQGRNPLHIAAFCSDDLANVQPLVELDKTCNINARSLHKETALHLAAWADHPTTFSYLIQRGASLDIGSEEYPLLFELIMYKSLKVLRVYLTLDINLRQVSANGQTVFHVLAGHASLEVLSAFVNVDLNGIARDQKNDAGLTALQLVGARKDLPEGFLNLFKTLYCSVNSTNLENTGTRLVETLQTTQGGVPSDPKNRLHLAWAAIQRTCSIIPPEQRSVHFTTLPVIIVAIALLFSYGYLQNLQQHTGNQ